MPSLSFMLCAIAALTGASWADQSGLNYIQQLNTFSEGSMDTQGSTEANRGVAWLNVTGYAPDKLPYIQKDLGIYTRDNINGLKAAANLAATAASHAKYGDLVYLFNVFAMNGFGPYAQISSNEMQQGLLAAVTPHGSSTPDQELIELYANTSSISSLREAFLALKNLQLQRPITANTSPHLDYQKRQ